MPFLLPNHQHQSTEGTTHTHNRFRHSSWWYWSLNHGVFDNAVVSWWGNWRTVFSRCSNRSEPLRHFCHWLTSICCSSTNQQQAMVCQWRDCFHVAGCYISTLWSIKNVPLLFFCNSGKYWRISWLFTTIFRKELWNTSLLKFLPHHNSFLNILVKKLRKSVNICQSYRKNKSGTFLCTTVYIYIFWHCLPSPLFYCHGWIDPA